MEMQCVCFAESSCEFLKSLSGVFVSPYMNNHVMVNSIDLTSSSPVYPFNVVS